MTLIIKYFGMVAEASGKQEEKLQQSFYSVKELKQYLNETYPKFETLSFKIAVNQTLVEDNFKLIGKEEIALLPPFAGG